MKYRVEYLVQKKCDYPMPNPFINEDNPCEDAAIARFVWPDDSDWFLCEEHLEFVMKCEDEDNEEETKCPLPV